MGHHIGDFDDVSLEWSQICNDLIHRVCTLFPKNFIGVCQLPQTQGVAPTSSIKELERCVKELGIVGCNLNPDPSGGYFNAPPLTDKWWYPFYEKMIELDVPAMIHVSGCCNPAQHTTGSYYLNADTMAFMQLIAVRPVQGFPEAASSSSRMAAARCRSTGAASAGIALDNKRPELDRDHGQQRVLRHLRLSSARHRSADQGGAGRQHPVRLGDGRRGARASIRIPATISTTPSATSTARRTSPPPTSRRSSRATR